MLLSFPLDVSSVLITHDARSEETSVRLPGYTESHLRKQLFSVLHVAVTSYDSWLVFIVEIYCVYCEVGSHCFKAIHMNFVFRGSVPWLRRLVAGLSPPRPDFDPGSIHMRFVVDRVALERVFLVLLRFPAVFIISPMMHTGYSSSYHYYQKDKRAKPGNFQTKRCFFGYREALDIK
jgi:hypothetical protein